MLPFIIFCVMVVVMIISAKRLYNFSAAFDKIKNFETPTDSNPKVKVSVIIPMRNEEKNISDCLLAVLNQNYPKDLLEVIVVDDHSEDDSVSLAKALISSSKINAQLIKLDNTRTGKKAAISHAIDNSSGELIITTDADCVAKENWVKTVASFFELHKPSMILGPVDFNIENSFFDKIQNLEFLGLMTVTGGAAKMGKPIMCNGANLAYAKSAFIEVNGFHGVNDIPSGDDVFLMLKMDEKHPNSVRFLKSIPAIVSTKPQQSLKDFINQRKRWLSKRPGYKNPFLISTAILNYLSNVLVFISIILALALNSWWSWKWTALILLFKIIGDLSLLETASSWFNKRNLLRVFPISQIFVIIYVSLLGIFGNGGKYSWKGRQVKP